MKDENVTFNGVTFLGQCCVCSKYRNEDGEFQTEKPFYENYVITHTYCKPCAKEQIRLTKEQVDEQF